MDISKISVKLVFLGIDFSVFPDQICSETGFFIEKGF